MPPKTLLALALLGHAPTALPCEAPRPAPDPVPITIILLDDVDWDTWELAHKPHIDAIAKEGVTFTRAWGYPLCSPARAALLTGRHASRTGIGDLVNAGAGKGMGLRQAEVTLAELLHGERTAAFGKWHLAGIVEPGHPNAQGFDDYVGVLTNVNQPGVGRDYFHWKEVTNGQEGPVRNEYLTRATTENALRSDATFRYIAYHAIHKPAHDPPGWSETTWEGRKAAMLEYVDREIGRLFGGKYDPERDGWVFLLGDNNRQRTLSGKPGKSSLREAGLHVPFLVGGPGVDDAVRGRKRDDLASIVDVFPTVAEIRGVDPGEVDGFSLVPVLRGGEGGRTTNFAEFFSVNNFDPRFVDGKWRRTIRGEGRYKLRHNVIKEKLTLWRIIGDDQEVEIPEPWTGEDLRAARYLRSRLPEVTFLGN